MPIARYTDAEIRAEVASQDGTDRVKEVDQSAGDSTLLAGRSGLRAAVLGGHLELGASTTFKFTYGSSPTDITEAISATWDRRLGEALLIAPSGEDLKLTVAGSNNATGHVYVGYLATGRN